MLRTVTWHCHVGGNAVWAQRWPGLRLKAAAAHEEGQHARPNADKPIELINTDLTPGTGTFSAVDAVLHLPS